VLRPQQPAPPLEVSLVGGGRWSLAEQRPDHFTLVIFYRGHHCPVCRGYLVQLDGLLDGLADVGTTSVIAVSGDDEQRATLSVEKWGLGRLAIGYGQPVDSMREWGLYISKGIKPGEPELFGEPGLFLVRSDGTLYAAIVNSMPFGRPHLEELVGAIGWVTDNQYPARGES